MEVDRIGCRLLTLSARPLTVPALGPNVHTEFHSSMPDSTRRGGAITRCPVTRCPWWGNYEVPNYEVPDTSITRCPITRCLTPRRRTPRPRRLDPDASTPTNRPRRSTARCGAPRVEMRPTGSLRGVHYEVSDTSKGTPRKGTHRGQPLDVPVRVVRSVGRVGPRGYAPDTRARCPWERVRGRVGDGWVGASQRGDARRRDPVPGHARASALRPLRCAFAARQHAEPLLIHRMSAQGDPPRESRRTRRGLPRQWVRACIRRTGPQGFVREMN